MELNFSETAKSNMMSSASTLSFAAAALNTGADENDFASHLDDTARENTHKEDKYDENALDRKDELRAKEADEARADEQRTEAKRDEEKRADEKHAEGKQADKEGTGEQTTLEVSLALDPALAAEEATLAETDMAALEAEQAEFAGSRDLSTPEEDVEALSALNSQDEQAGTNDEQEHAAIGIAEATVIQAQTTATPGVRETTQNANANMANAANTAGAVGEDENMRLNLQNGEGGDTNNAGKKTLGQQAAEKLASSRAKAGNATTSNETTVGKSGNTPAAVSNLVSSKETTQATSAFANAVAGTSATGRGAAPTQNFNTFNLDTLAGLGSNQSNGPQNMGAVLIRVGTLPGQTQATQVPNTAIAMQMNKNIQKGISNFEIRLDPAELGRVDIKMEISTDGRLTAHMVVENPETLDLLRKDAQALEKALSDSGLDMDNDALTFSLSEDNQQTASQEAENKNASTRMSDQETGSEDENLSTAPTYYFSNNTSGVDIRV